MAFFKLLDLIARFNADDHDGGKSGGASLVAAWAIVMCMAVIALLVLYGCADPDPFKGF